MIYYHLTRYHLISVNICLHRYHNVRQETLFNFLLYIFINLNGFVMQFNYLLKST